jgi:hypothetical protein
MMIMHSLFSRDEKGTDWDPFQVFSFHLHGVINELNREVHRLHNYNKIQNKEDTTVSTFVLLY